MQHTKVMKMEKKFGKLLETSRDGDGDNDGECL